MGTVDFWTGRATIRCRDVRTTIGRRRPSAARNRAVPPAANLSHDTISESASHLTRDHVVQTGAHWSDRRVLVTGATGLVGAWLCRWLVERDAFVVTYICDMDPQSELMRSGVVERTNVVNGRLEEPDVVERAINLHEVDTVMHLGAQTIVGTAFRSPRRTFEANIAGTWNVLDACRRHPNLVKRVVVASSDKAYGTSEILPYVEGMPLNGRAPYEVSKSCTDLIAQSYARHVRRPGHDCALREHLRWR